MVTKHNCLAFSMIALLILAGAVYSTYLGNDLRIWDEEEYVALAKNLGYLVLAIPTLAFPLLIIVARLVLARHQVRSAAMLSLASMLIIGLWTFRNYAVFNSFVSVSTNSGLSLLIGNSEETTSMWGLNGNFQGFMAQTTGMDELQNDAYYRSRAIKFMVTSPPRAVQLYIPSALTLTFATNLVV